MQQTAQRWQAHPFGSGAQLSLRDDPAGLHRGRRGADGGVLCVSMAGRAVDYVLRRGLQVEAIPQPATGKRVRTLGEAIVALGIRVLGADAWFTQPPLSF